MSNLDDIKLNKEKKKYIWCKIMIQVTESMYENESNITVKMWLCFKKYKYK